MRTLVFTFICSLWLGMGVGAVLHYDEWEMRCFGDSVSVFEFAALVVGAPFAWSIFVANGPAPCPTEGD